MKSRKTKSLQSIPRVGRFIHFTNHSTVNVMNGRNDNRTAISPITRRPLLRMLDFDADSFSIPGPKRISLYYEWRSELSYGPFSYELLENGDIKVLSFNTGKALRDFPYKDYPIFFPRRYVEMLEIAPRDQEEIISASEPDFDHYSLYHSRPRLAGC